MPCATVRELANGDTCIFVNTFDGSEYMQYSGVLKERKNFNTIDDAFKLYCGMDTKIRLEHLTKLRDYLIDCPRTFDFDYDLDGIVKAVGIPIRDGEFGGEYRSRVFIDCNTLWNQLLFAYIFRPQWKTRDLTERLNKVINFHSRNHLKESIYKDCQTHNVMDVPCGILVVINRQYEGEEDTTLFDYDPLSFEPYRDL